MPKAEYEASYIDGCVAFGEVFIRELTDQANIFLNDFSLFLHLLDAVLASFLLKPLKNVLILLNNLDQFSFPVGLIQSLLLILASVLVQARV